MRERHPARRVPPRLASAARRWRCRARDVGECRHSVPAELMLRRATPTEWARCVARPSDPHAVAEQQVGEETLDAPPLDAPLEQSGYWRCADDDED